VTGWLAVVVSAVSGAAITLLGVVAGGIVASRSQRRQWTRDKQIEACAAIVEESTRMQLALLQRWKRGNEADWTGWNQKLAMLWLVGTPDVIAEARMMDRAFWLGGGRITSGLMTNETWATARDEMEAARRRFINAARLTVVDAKVPVDDAPVARPPLSEIHQMFGTAPDQPVPSTDQPEEESAAS